MTDKKDIEFLVEEKKLEEVSNILNEEMLSYINKRKFVTQYILDYREKMQLKNIKMMKIK